MIKEWIESYNPKNREQVNQALREIMQEIALAGLQRSGFFEKAAFYGGTTLRIFHQLDRFSEDLDFSLLARDDHFSLRPYLSGVMEEFAALGMNVSVVEKIKTQKTNVDSAFLKSDTLWTELNLENILPEMHVSGNVSIKIKIEIDTAPPPGFLTEEKLLLKPFSFYVRCYQLPDLFAGKMHALLFRKWKQRVKGRDWYDMEWYIRKGVRFNKTHFIQRAIDSKDLSMNEMSNAEFQQLLREKIQTTSINAVKEDVIRFIDDENKLSIWSKNYFLDLIERIQFD
jgi:predicted nucleotidyltransferase component of viral defense system